MSQNGPGDLNKLLKTNSYTRIRPGTQLFNIKEVMSDKEWHSLGEIAQITGYPESSISAQLRHLRKDRYGAHLVEKRYCPCVGAGFWEYTLGKRGDNQDGCND